MEAILVYLLDMKKKLIQLYEKCHLATTMKKVIGIYHFNVLFIKKIIKSVLNYLPSNKSKRIII